MAISQNTRLLIKLSCVLCTVRTRLHTVPKSSVRVVPCAFVCCSATAGFNDEVGIVRSNADLSACIVTETRRLFAQAQSRLIADVTEQRLTSIEATAVILQDFATRDSHNRHRCILKIGPKSHFNQMGLVRTNKQMSVIVP